MTCCSTRGKSLDGIHLLVRFKIKNTGTNSQSFEILLLSLRWGEGKKFVLLWYCFSYIYQEMIISETEMISILLRSYYVLFTTFPSSLLFTV